MASKSTRQKNPQKADKQHPATKEPYVGHGDGLTPADYRFRNRLKNRLARTRDRATLNKVADALGLPPIES